MGFVRRYTACGTKISKLHQKAKEINAFGTMPGVCF